MLFKRVINRSLNLKDFKKSDVKKKINDFINFETSFGKGGFYSLKDELYTYLFNKISNRSNNLREKFKNIDEINKEIIDFFLFRISKSINDQDSWSGFREYAFNDEGEMLKVDTENWAHEFNIICKKQLKKLDYFTIKYPYGDRDQVIYFWEFYDKILSLGIGYYIPWITNTGQVSMHFKVFKYIYINRHDIFPFLKDMPPLMVEEKDLQNFFKDIKKTRIAKETWEDDESFFSDIEFESSDRSRYIPYYVKNVVWERDGGRCVKCGSTVGLQWDHDIPFSKGGANTIENIQILCAKCNIEKRDKIQ